jgi:hypothetical protein
MQRSLSAWRRVPGLDSRTAQHSPLRGYSTDTQWRSAVVSQWLGGVRSGAPVHAQRTPAQRTAHRPLPRDDDASGIGRAIHGVVCKKQSQANTQTNKQTKTHQTHKCRKTDKLRDKQINQKSQTNRQKYKQIQTNKQRKEMLQTGKTH